MDDLTKYEELFPKNFPFAGLAEIETRFPGVLHSETSETVFRIAITGTIDYEFFLPSILEDRNKTRYTATRIKPVSLADWSVSCYTIKKDAYKTLCILKKHNPPAALAVGIIREGTGLWAHTNEWNDTTGNSHVDWWIIADSFPLNDFEVVNGTI